MRALPLALLLIAVPASGQAPPNTAPTKAGEAFRFMAGSWRGDAWVQMGPQRITFTQTERVSPYLDDSVLLVEGRAIDDGNPAARLFHAFGVLSYNAETGGFEFRTYANGRAGTFPARLEGGNSLVWEIAGANGVRTRYTHRIEGDRWTGSGEITRDGKSWSPIFGMTLKRTGAASFAPAAPGK